MNKIGKVERRKVYIHDVLHYEVWKLIKRYPYKVAHSRDLRKKGTASDSGHGARGV